MFAQAAQLGISVSTFHHFTEMHLLKGPDEGHKDLVLLKVRKETKEEEKNSSQWEANPQPGSAGVYNTYTITTVPLHRTVNVGSDVDIF